MNELFFKIKNKLNTLNKKIIIISVLAIITFILLIFFLVKPKENVIQNEIQTPIYNEETNTTTFLNKDNTISLELSSNYGLKQYIPTGDYLLELRSDNNLNIFISSKELIPERSLKDVVLADRLAFSQSFSKTSNLSELQEFSVGENMAYSYSFHYLDESLNTSFYIQITWLEINGKYYIFDIEFPLEHLNNYTQIITDVVYNFKEI